MKKYKPTIGLEIHAELRTKTKMFCDCANDPDEKSPNVNICPVCMAHPGTLPVINKQAVGYVLKVGRALGGELADFTEFDRKNYFYPDIPKGYQISQYAYPLVSGGSLLGVDITRVHLEEDTGTSVHDRGEYSLVNYNRAGVPLLELVTEPVVQNAKEAGRFGREFQLLLRFLGASEANMEKGQMRVEANISVSDTEEFGTKVEVKNLNSFRVLERAIEYEIDRQSKVLEDGGSVSQETRGWDENKNETFPQRKKESADDYRYFPDPDLPKLKISEIPEFEDLELPELPEEMRVRYKKDYGVSDEAIEIFVRDDERAGFFEKVAEILGQNKKQTKLASNYLTSDISALIKEHPQVSFTDHMTPPDFASLIGMTDSGELSSRGAKNILKVLFLEGGDVRSIATEKDLLQKNNEDELMSVVLEIIEENAEVVREYREGKEASLKFLIGQGMKKTKGSANPEVLERLLREKMKG